RSPALTGLATAADAPWPGALEYTVAVSPLTRLGSSGPPSPRQPESASAQASAASHPTPHPPVAASSKGRHSDGPGYRAQRADRRAHGGRRLSGPQRGDRAKRPPGIAEPR